MPRRSRTFRIFVSLPFVVLLGERCGSRLLLRQAFARLMHGGPEVSSERYSIERVMTEGRTCRIYRARDELLQRSVVALLKTSFAVS